MGNSESYLRLLPEETTASVARLELLVRRKMEGGTVGRHRSPNKGSSVEFAEHRQYVKGDNLRDLDWRIYAKTNRYYVKQYVEETNLRATILLDVSGSMGYRGERGCEIGGELVSKFDYARYLAAALAYFVGTQQDAVGLAAFDSRLRTMLRPSSRPSQTRTILEKLDRLQPGEESRLSEVLHEVAERIPRRGTVVLISDLFDDPEAILKALHHFQFHGHEVIVFQVLAEEELAFPFKRSNHFRDLESPDAHIEVDPATVRAEYLDRLRAFLETLERGCARLETDYRVLSTRDPFDRCLAEYLANRRRRQR